MKEKNKKLYFYGVLWGAALTISIIAVLHIYFYLFVGKLLEIQIFGSIIVFFISLYVVIRYNEKKVLKEARNDRKIKTNY